MFTGLIEDVGCIDALQVEASGATVTIGAKVVLSDLALGSSIAVDGVCTTVTAFDEKGFTFEASPETLSKTTMKHYQVGRQVNLERPLKPMDRLGGHFVTGHVDGTAVVISKQAEGMSWVYHFRLQNEAFAPLVIEKGSVAINGVSLTVNDVKGSVFSVAIIPHTLTNTQFGSLEPDTLVNIETDMLGKYVQRFLQMGQLGQGEMAQNPKKTNLHTGIWFNLEPPITVPPEHPPKTPL